jgi:triosephosphate isomerase (TIM)
MSPQRKPLMAANWKMHKTVSEALDFATRLKDQLKNTSPKDLPDIVLCPPFTALHALRQFLTQNGVEQVNLGSQNISANTDGAYTGEIAPRMLTDLGVKYAIIGHSERREYNHETDADVNAKIVNSLKNGLTPIVCVGETLAQRETGETDAWVQKQVKAALEGISEEDKRKIVFAYEPIWAIGTGKVCDAAEANRVIEIIRETAGVPELRILYGGSMKPDNVADLMAQPAIDGGLVGGASLEADSFFKLIQAAMPVKV